jgi:hypothetical protein
MGMCCPTVAVNLPAATMHLPQDHSDSNIAIELETVPIHVSPMETSCPTVAVDQPAATIPVPVLLRPLRVQSLPLS